MPSSLILKKFGALTEIQQQAMPLIIEGRNVLVIAPTGSGKTLTVALPIMKKIADEKLTGIAAIYCSPLRALNRDLLKNLTEWAKELGVSIAVRHGDTSQFERALQAKNPPQFLIITPETLQAILPAKKIGAALKNVKVVIIDEVHELIDDKRGIQLSIALERLAEKAGEFQRVGLSATVSDPNMVSRFLCGFRSCDIIDLNYLKSMKFEISYPKAHLSDEAAANELMVDSPAAARLKEILKIVKDTKTLIFVNTRSIAEILGSRLMKLDPKIAVHHGSLSRDTRIQIEDDFKGGKLNALVATSSLELGIDIGDVNHVIQYMSPHQVSRLVQRVGRSGHTVKGTSAGTIICADSDDVLEATAIIDLIKEGSLESQRICANALDVLCHQIAGILMDKDADTTSPAIFDIIKRAYPYSMLDSDQFMSVIDFMNDKRLLKKTEQGLIHRMSSTRMYYYEHLSTIPSVDKFMVRDAATNKVISTLDENFVALLEHQDMFITKGVPWRILDIDPDKRMIVVEATEDISAAIPDWEGEEIPTSFEICQKVGELRDKIAKGKLSIREADDDIKEFGENVPDQKHLYIEAWGDVAVLHVLGGLNVNRTLASIIGNRLAKEYGSSVRTLVDPYRIAFVFPRGADALKVKHHLQTLANPAQELEEGLPKNQLFKYKFIHIGKMFHLFRETPRISDRFILAFKDTPVYAETVREVLYSYYDIKRTNELLKAIREKEIKVTAAQVKKLSAVGMRALIRHHGAELIAPIEPTSEIVKAFKMKLLGKSVILYCTHCEHDWIAFIGALPDKVKCARCGSTLITMPPERYRMEAFKLYKKTKLTSQEKIWKDKLDKTAAVISASGKKGVIALSTYGIGPTKSVGVLGKKFATENEFFAALLEAQKTFIRTKRYWEFH